MVVKARVRVHKPRSRKPEVQLCDQPVLLPHIVFSHLFRNKRALFASKFLGPNGGSSTLRQFWNEVVRRRDPRIVRHPMCDRPNWQDYAIPICVHGDAVPVVRVGRPGTKSLDCLSWQSLMAQGVTLGPKLLMTAVFEPNKLAGGEGLEGTMETLWRVMAWSLNILFSGTFPEKDWQGEAWAPGSSEAILCGTRLCSGEEPFFCVTWSIKGDLDWYAKSLHLRHYHSLEPCDYCECKKGANTEMWPTNFQPSAPWKDTMRSGPAWRAASGHVHTLFREITYLSVLNLECDELHILHLGVVQWFLGSVLWLLVFVIKTGYPGQNMGEVWAAILAAYEEFPNTVQMTSMGLSSFTDPKKPHAAFPKLGGSWMRD